MYAYLVHVLRENPFEWRISTSNGWVVASNKERVDTTGRIDAPGKEAEMETWYCTNEEDAAVLAKHLAIQRAGVDIYISKTIMIAKSTPREPRLLAVTEKGLVPK